MLPGPRRLEASGGQPDCRRTPALGRDSTFNLFGGTGGFRKEFTGSPG